MVHLFDLKVKRRAGAAIIGFLYTGQLVGATIGVIFACVSRWNAAFTREQQMEAVVIDGVMVLALVGGLMLVRLMFEFVAMLYAVLHRAETTVALYEERAYESGQSGTRVETPARTHERGDAAA
jgi:hypothetical protein